MSIRRSKTKFVLRGVALIAVLLVAACGDGAEGGQDVGRGAAAQLTPAPASGGESEPSPTPDLPVPAIASFSADLIQLDNGVWCTELPGRVSDFVPDRLSGQFVAQFPDLGSGFAEVVVERAYRSKHPGQLLETWLYDDPDGGTIALRSFGMFVGSPVDRVLVVAPERGGLAPTRYFVPGPDGTWQYLSACASPFHEEADILIEQVGIPGGRAAANRAVLSLLVPDQATGRIPPVGLSRAERDALRAALPADSSSSAPLSDPDGSPWEDRASDQRSFLDDDLPRPVIDRLEQLTIELSLDELRARVPDSTVVCFATITAMDVCWASADPNIEGDIWVVNRLPGEDIGLYVLDTATGAVKQPPVLTIPGSAPAGQPFVIVRES